MVLLMHTVYYVKTIYDYYGPQVVAQTISVRAPSHGAHTTSSLLTAYQQQNHTLEQSEPLLQPAKLTENSAKALLPWPMSNRFAVVIERRARASTK